MINKEAFEALEQSPGFREKLDEMGQFVAAEIRKEGYTAEWHPGTGLHTNAAPSEMARIVGVPEEDVHGLMGELVEVGGLDREVVEQEVMYRVSQLTNRQAHAILHTVSGLTMPDFPTAKTDELVGFGSQRYVNERGEEDIAVQTGMLVFTMITASYDEPDNAKARHLRELVWEVTSPEVPAAFRRS